MVQCGSNDEEEEEKEAQGETEEVEEKQEPMEQNFLCQQLLVGPLHSLFPIDVLE